jgi:hypothetical protein
LDSQSEESPLGAATGPVLDPDERRELDRLRREVAALRATPAPRRARFRWASLAAAVLLVLGCVGVPASVLAVWTHNQLADTDRFVATVSPVIEDPFVHSAGQPDHHRLHDRHRPLRPLRHRHARSGRPGGQEVLRRRLPQASGHRTLEGDDQTLDGPWPDPPLDVRVSDGLEHPALPRLIIQDLLEPVSGERPTDPLLEKLDDPILHPLQCVLHCVALRSC